MYIIISLFGPSWLRRENTGHAARTGDTRDTNDTSRAQDQEASKCAAGPSAVAWDTCAPTGHDACEQASAVHPHNAGRGRQRHARALRPDYYPTLCGLWPQGTPHKQGATPAGADDARVDDMCDLGESSYAENRHPNGHAVVAPHSLCALHHARNLCRPRPSRSIAKHMLAAAGEGACDLTMREEDLRMLDQSEQNVIDAAGASSSSKDARALLVNRTSQLAAQRQAA